MVSFRREDRGRVAEGEITVTFRLWSKPKVKAGNRYATGFGTIEVEEVSVIPAALVSPDDVPRSGCADIASIWELAGEHTGTRVTPEMLLYRVAFRFLGDAPVRQPTTAPGDLAQIASRLHKLDRLSSRGPWTLTFLRMIESAPRVPARLLAAEAGWETPDFKANVRKLKRLGLTISHDVGYELAPLGRDYLASLA